MLEPERDGVGAGRGGQLVHERLDREDVHVRTERAHRRRLQRHGRRKVVHHVHVGECVQRNRVAVAAAFGLQHRRRRCRHERFLQHLRGKEPACVDDPLVVRTAPQRVIPVDDGAARVERRAHFGDHRGGEVIPGMLLFAHPLHANRLAHHFAGDQGGVRCCIVGAVVPIAARSLDVNAAHLFLRH